MFLTAYGRWIRTIFKIIKNNARKEFDILIPWKNKNPCLFYLDLYIPLKSISYIKKNKRIISLRVENSFVFVDLGQKNGTFSVLLQWFTLTDLINCSNCYTKFIMSRCRWKNFSLIVCCLKITRMNKRRYYILQCTIT